MSTNFIVIGGDLRIVKLIEMLANSGNTVYTYGLENSEELNSKKNKYRNINFCESLDSETLKETKVVIGPIPFSKDGITINSLYSKKEITIEYVFNFIRNKTLIAGSIPKNLYAIAKEKNIKLIDLMQNEKLAVLNCISTAEGAIDVAINNTDEIIHGKNSLILGFGRVSKVLAKKLQGLDVKVTCAARKDEAFAWIRAYGYDLININKLGENLSKFDIIFNTVPNLILDKEKIEYLSGKCLIVELASRPGGIDRTAAKNKNVKVVEALALPGKVAPVTTARYIKEAIFETIKNI